MAEHFIVKGGAGEFEAAVIAVVLDQLERDEKAAAQGKTTVLPRLPAWVRALTPPDDPNMPREIVWPD